MADRRRPGGRDYRERSPFRDPQYEDRLRDRGRDERSQAYDDRYGTSQRSAYDQRRGEGRGRGRGAYSGDQGGTNTLGDTVHPSVMSSGEKLADLPSEVPLPKDGRRLDLPIRPAQGTIGRPITLAVNHFQIQSLPIIKIFQFEVLMRVPPSSQRRGSEKVSAMQHMKAILKAQESWGRSFVFDGVSLGWSIENLLPIGEERTALFDLDGHDADRPNQVEVTIRNTGTLNIKKFVGYLTDSGAAGVLSHDIEIADVFRALNAIYRQDPASRLITRPKSTAFFTRAPGLTLNLQSTGGILEALRGAFQAVSYSFGRLCLNVDVVCSAFYVPDKCVVEVAQAMAGISPRQNPNDPSSNSLFRSGCERLVGMFFVVRHLDSVKNAKKMRIQRLSPEGARSTTFEELDRATGKSAVTTVESYFQRKYNIIIKYPDIPLVASKDGMFPMELCYTPYGERYKEALQGQETSDFIKWATSPAFVRIQQIIDNVKRLAWHTLSIPKGMGLSVSPSMLQIRGRRLPCPIPVYGAGTDSQGPETGQWNLRNKKFIKPAGFHGWGLLYLPGGGRQAHDIELQNFCKAMSKSLSSVGITTSGSPPAFLKGNPYGDIKQEISQLVGKCAKAFGAAKPDLLVILLHDKANPLIYKAVKSVCEVEYGIPSQVMIVEKALRDKGQMQYLGNIGLKVNCKLGGVNSSIEEPLFRRSKFMMIGGDSSHPSPGELRKMPPPPSYCALVGSYDSNCVAYSGVAASQPATVELIGTFGPMVTELMKRFHNRNRFYPDSVIYWRDGIAESQIPQFLNSGVRNLRDAFKEAQKSVKITVINCVKRHHTRLFPQSERGDKLGNVFPGTVVENAEKDIFLVSQSALQGTVRPCHYTVLLDENNLSADDFERLALNGTFSYGRATRSVSIHPAVYYADQVAERAKLHLRKDDEGDDTVLRDVHDNLKYTMYWQ